MNRIIRVKQVDDAPEMQLTWLINNICTNSCSYCPPTLHSGTNHHYEWKNAKRFFEILFEKYSSVHCSVAGGEPSVSPFFTDLIKIFYNSGHSIGITSNAARSVRFWEENSKYLNYVCFSYHPESPDPHFIEKINVAKMQTLVTVRVMMLPSKWDHCVEMFEKLSELNHICVESVRIFDWDGTNKTAHVYTEDQLLWFTHNERNQSLNKTPGVDKKAVRILCDYHLEDGTVLETPNAVDYINSGMTNFYGYTCEVGLRSLFVDWRGRIFLGNCGVGGIIGNINYPSTIQWPTTSVVCNKTLCHCATDVNINKWV